MQTRLWNQSARGDNDAELSDSNVSCSPGGGRVLLFQLNRRH